MCAMLLLAAFPLLAQGDKPSAVGGKNEASPKLPCTHDCVALPNAPSATSPEAPPEPPPKPYSLVGPVASAPFVPLTPRKKLGIFVHHTYSPYTVVSAGIGATWSQMVGNLPAYGGGMQGWGKRFGESMADTEARSFFGSFLFPTLTHEDPRYFPMRKGSLWQRVWYAGTRVLVTRKDDGGHTFNFSEFLGTAVTATLSNAYLPVPDRGAWNSFSRGYGAIGGDAGSFVLEEFWPDIQRFFHRHAPKSVQKIENKLPPSLVGTPQ